MDRSRRFDHIDSLDGLRGLAAVIVLINHTNVALEKAPEVLTAIRESPLALLINGNGAPLVCGAVYLPTMRRFLSAPSLVHFGKISYSFYLYHLTVLILVTRMITGPAGIAEAMAVLVVSLVVTTGCAEVSYRLVERPSIAAGNAICARVAAKSGVPAQLSSLLR